MMDNKLIYITSPYAGEVEKNVDFAKAACRYAMTEGHTPVAVHLLYPQFLNDGDPAQRAAGLIIGHRVLVACDEVWVNVKKLLMKSRKPEPARMQALAIKNFA